MTDIDKENIPALHSMDSQMTCCALTGSDGQFLICHDKATYSPVYWVEYDTLDNSFTFVYKGGTVQKLGLTIDKQMHENILHSKEVTIAHMVDSNIVSAQVSLLVVKNYDS